MPEGGSSVRVAVVGVGTMGGNHCRVLSTLKGAELVGVYDRDRVRAAAVAEQFGVPALHSLDAVEEQADAACVTVTSECHAEVGCDLLSRGIHCLIEKPLATSPGDVAAILGAARSGGGRLLVGHIERFNPAVSQLKGIIDPALVLAVEAQRMSAVSGRVRDVDVVLDLMVHDIDIALDITGDEVVEITARAARRGNADGSDYVTALLTLGSGALVTLTASRITQNQIRSLALTTRDRLYTVDYPEQELLIYRQGRLGEVPGTSFSDGRYVLDVGTERVFVRRVEPLVEELRHFLEVVAGAAEPVVSGDDAHRVLQVIWAINDQLAEAAR